MRFQALKELLFRYWQIFTVTWAARKNMMQAERSSHELAFLPAALELQETPPHPAARVTLWATVTFLLIALIWAFFGKIDVVAVAPGKLIVSDQSKIIQPLEPGMVKAIHVQDGQFVQAGQILIELDSTITGAENDKNSIAWIDAKLEGLRAKALLEAIKMNRPPQIPSDPDSQQVGGSAYKVRLADSQRLVQSQWQEFQTKLAAMDADTDRRIAERAGAKEQVNKLEQTLPIVSQRTADYKDLFENSIISKHDYYDKEQIRIETVQNLAVLRRKLEELTEGIKTNRRQKESTVAEFRRTQNDTFTKATERTHEFAQEMVKAKQRYNQTQLTAPVSGVVQQLAIHTVGGVVTEAQPLMVIVPKKDDVLAEVMLENKDIGFVKEGQKAAVKIETFNFTKYGLIDGIVQTVSLDAIQDEKRGLVYSSRILLNQNTMQVEGKTVPLTPGMAVTAEVKTAKRRIVEYFLSPLIQKASESLRER